MIHRSFRYGVITITLLLPLTVVVLWPLRAGPDPQGTSRRQTPEQDKLVTGPPFSLEQILGLVDVHPDRLSKAILNRGLAFEATPENLEALKKGGAPDKLIDLVRRRAPPRTVASPPPPPPPSGNLLVKCSPAECNISIEGKSVGQTKGGTLEVKGLPLKDFIVDFEREGYIGHQKTIMILDGKDVSAEAELEPSEATKAQFGADLFAMTVQALGGEVGLKDVASLSASGAAVVWSKDGQRGDWTLSALLKLPNMALFDLEGSSPGFWLSLVGDKYKSGGNRKKLGGLLGGGSSDTNHSLEGGEFDSSLRVFRDFQIAALVDRVRSRGFRVSAVSHEEDDKGESHLRAAATAEIYELTLDHDKLPTRMKYESELGLGTGMEIVYSGYKDVGKGKYPLTMVIKLPDAPHHGMEVRFESAMPSADLREKDFNGRIKPRK